MTRPHGELAFLRHVWRLLDPRQRRRFVALVGLSLLAALSTLGGIVSVFPFLAVLTNPQVIERYEVLQRFQAEHAHDTQSFLLLLSALFVAMTVLSSIVNLLSSLAMERFAQQLNADLNVILFDEYLHRDVQFHLRAHSAELYNRIIVDCRRLAIGVVHSTLVLVSAACSCLLIASTVVWINSRAAVIAAAVLGGAFLLAYLLARRRLARNGRRLARDVAAQTRLVSESLSGFREVLLLRNPQFFQRRFRAHCDAVARNLANTTAIGQSPRYIVECLTAAGLIALALWSGRAAPGGQWIAQISVLALATYRLLPAMQTGFASLACIRANTDVFDRIESDLRRGLERRRAPPAEPRNGEWRGRPKIGIAIESVTFRYEPERAPALRELSLRIPAGAMVGVVGANGSGKSTLADLVLGLLAPQSGRVEVDGMVLDARNRAAWQSTVAYVPQDVLLLDASIAENVALGVEPADIDLERAWSALRLAGLEGLLSELPQGIESMVGEGGMRLSGGQRQKLGLARAFYCRASLLVLDEATSALDGMAEREVAEALQGLRGQTTILIIAHRLNAVRDCDVIHQLEQGAVVASGSYDALMNTSERFRLLAGTRA